MIFINYDNNVKMTKYTNNVMNSRKKCYGLIAAQSFPEVKTKRGL